MKTILITILILISINTCSAYTDVGDNLIEPRYYDGNLLIFNEGHISYSIFSESDYIGTINHNQGIFINESCNYSIYASYDEIRDIAVLEVVEKKFNQWWIIILVGIILLIGAIRVIKVIR